MGIVRVEVLDLDTVEWRHSTNLNLTIGDHADVWRVKINDHLSLIGKLKKLLLPDEIARAGRYYQEKDRHRFIVSRASLRVILGWYLNQKPEDIRFQTGTNKKPFVETAGIAVNYNVSHSDEWVTIAVSETAVGIDTEKIDPSFDYREILTDNFSEDEISFINQNNPAEKFILLWTRKESITKLTSQGLDERIKHIPSLNGDHKISDEIIHSSQAIKLVSFKLDNSNLATLAYEHEDLIPILFLDIDLTLI
ncbi:4'-phosphopantetheinyl transferase superfamily protein [Mucilaginibacter sp. SMC90]|uniref:4'-phosphopantetheinyl transferase family protein n=1 Tax=Mucilaginibacter sp. SMC90 TaxID=2929803 RepID=UPI001FB2112A|nr:4'-phosphopantetheinyl transferase superfamily protein [Mucilaginibacter sp. SMC90]UOE52113.1 4'-phosphopantetheinyl transferase superfamily protein [Mucilaginibacter sp. SMC90]